MAQSTISYAQKDELGVAPTGVVAASDLNSIKAVVNGNSVDAESRVGALELSDAGSVIIVKQASDLSGTLDATKTYFIDGIIDMGSASIEVPNGGLSIIGSTFDTSKLVSSASSHTMFTSPVGGCGNLLIRDITISSSGSSSNVFQLLADTGLEGVEFSRVLFLDCSSLGEIYGFRQGLEQGTIRLGGSPSLTLGGLWRGGYRITTSAIRGISGLATEPIFKEGLALQINSRFLTDINCDLPALAAFCDFTAGAFPNPSTVQVKDAIFSRDGVFDANDSNIFSHLNASDLACDWSNNVGLPNTFIGGGLTCNSEITTTINAINVAVDLAGTFASSDLQHFDSPSNGWLRHLGDNPREYTVSYNFAIDGNSNDVIDILLVKDDGTSVTLPFSQTRVINNLQGGRNIAYFNGQASVTLDKDDKVLWQVANLTGTGNVILEVDSEWSIKER